MLETKAMEILKADIEEKVEDDEVLRKVVYNITYNMRRWSTMDCNSKNAAAKKK